MALVQLPTSGIAGGDAMGHVRVEISLDIPAYLRGEHTPVTLKQVNTSGCLIESPVAMATDTIHQLRFTLNDGSVSTLLGRVTQSRKPAVTARPVWHLSLLFSHTDHPLVRAQISKLVASARAGRAAA
jgi:hypothetical protein